MQKVLDVVPKNLTLGVVILVMTLLAFYKGRKILYTMLIAFFPAVMFYQAITHWNTLMSMMPSDFSTGNYTYRLSVFLLLYIFMLYIINRVVGYEISRHGLHKALDAVLLAFGLVAESFILIFQTLELPDFYHLSQGIEGFLSSSAGIVTMLALATASLLYTSRA